MKSPSSSTSPPSLVAPMTMLPKAWWPTVPAATSNSVSTVASPSLMLRGSALSCDDESAAAVQLNML
ncbi:hypothetical protein MRB53_005721 [Persea americana]|uniref:Uncharacterized protein n=1 Tax=Persea americana TaxID=3435 RepID=A0ACC2MEE8_PERAE|nr:hypothetical protein MRB53_005721 [Persea americana]